MNPSEPSRPPPRPARAGRVWPGLLLIALAAGAAYADALRGPFLYDDTGAIERNLSIRHPASALLPPPGGLPVSGRPVANLSFALNYALGGLDPAGYHLFNLLIHVFAGWTLFGVIRRTLLRMGEASAASLALAAAVLWTVHPLQTEAVAYLSQRAESLMGLFYLLTLYCFIRHSDTGERAVEAPSPPLPPVLRRQGWGMLSILACLLGMGTKEVMVTAPVIVLLHDRTFLSGSFRQAWRRHRRMYFGLGSTWLLLAWLVAGAAGRGGTAGFGGPVSWPAYAFTQFRAVAHYLRLCFWPHPLAFNYGLILGAPPLAMFGDILVVILVVAASAVLLFRGSPLGFLGAWFFLILAPSSSLIPVATEIEAEHRVYLSLAAVTVAVVIGFRAGLRALGERLHLPRRVPAAAGALLVLGAAGSLARASFVRNRTYASALALWGDAVRATPDNAGARNNLGNALDEQAEAASDAPTRVRLLAEAEAEFRESLRLAPGYSDPEYNLGNVLVKEGRWAEAAEFYRAALRAHPDNAAIHCALGDVLRKLGREGEARGQFQEALAGSSDLPVVWYNLGTALISEQDLAGAAEAFGRALRLRPDYADALANDAGVLAQLGRESEAIVQFQAVLRLEPNAADVHNNLGGLLAESGRLAEAQAQFEEALRIDPGYREARDNLERVKGMEEAGNGR